MFFNLRWRDTIIFFHWREVLISLGEKPFFLEFALERYYWFFFQREIYIKCTLEDMSMTQQIENCQCARRGILELATTAEAFRLSGHSRHGEGRLVSHSVADTAT